MPDLRDNHFWDEHEPIHQSDLEEPAHDTDIERAGGRRRGTCSCGWHGRWRRGYAAGWHAGADADEHFNTEAA